MMFKFSCFQTLSQSHKHKKMAHLPTAAMPRIIDDSSEKVVDKNITYLTDANSSNLKPKLETSKSCVVESHSYLDEVEILPNMPVSKITHFKKSRSLGMGLDMKGKGSGGTASEDEIDQNSSSDGSRDNCGSFIQNEGKDSLIPLDAQFQEGHLSDSLHVFGDVGNNESVLSIGDAPHSDQDSHANFDGAQFSGEANSDSRAPGTVAPIFERSSSLPNSGSPGHFPVCSLRRIRSAEDLSVLLSKGKELFRHRSQALIIQNPGQIDALIGKNCSSNPIDGTHQGYNYFDSAKDWVIPLGDEVNVIDNHGEGSSFHQKDELLSKDFKVMRIEEWVTDLQNCGPLDESNGHSPLDGHTVPSDKIVLDVLPAKKLEGNFSPGMEVVKKYISSLSPAETHAQLVNYGLPVIPFLSAFSSLRALNLSGNAIARITAGSLPRGLHILNLSKNKISTIEGLRELTRLRVLDLSYNRILKIGHGLASCSSLKELYLAGNKISKVEGLHRLLKLNVLDLRFNKISTTKGLGQLAANYNSLQAISLEGNPAQKNVGDEQMKKCLQGLLPHLTYFNRQSIKAGTLKDSADRSARLGISAHQIDRGSKADFKLTRKGTHSAASSKVISSSSHGRRSQAPAVSKSSKNRTARLPPSGTKPLVQQNPLHALNNPHLPSLKSDFSIRRSRSEGTLAL